MQRRTSGSWERKAQRDISRAARIRAGNLVSCRMGSQRSEDMLAARVAHLRAEEVTPTVRAPT